MFTGIVEEIGIIKSIKNGEKSSKITIGASKVLKGSLLGDSILTNGICLTVCKIGENYFEVDVMAESLRRSNLGDLKVGDKVKVKKGSSWYDGQSIASFVYDNEYGIIQINGNRVVIGINGKVTGAILLSNLIKAQ